MSMRPVKKGSTDQSVVIRIIDSSDGTPEPAVEHNTAGIDLWYRKEGATKTSITEAALAALDSAHSDGGIEHIGDGYYRLDLPDAAFAAGADGVMVGGTVTGMIVIGCYVPLVDYDPYDSVRAGLTAMPNAAADAAGGLPVSDAGGLDLDTLLSRLTANVATEAKQDTIDTVVDAIKAKTDNLPADPADDSDIDTQLAAISSAISGLNDLSAADVNAEVDTALQEIHLDHLLAADYDPASKPGIATALLNELVENDGGVSRFTQNALEQSPSGGTNPNVLVTTTIASVTSQTEFVLTAGSNDDDAYKDQAVVLYDASDSDYPSIRKATAYTGGSKTLTIDSAPDFTIVGGDGVKIFVTAPGTTAPTTSEIVSAWLAATGVTVGGTWTMADWLKMQIALAGGNFRDKSGSSGVYEILDPDDGSTVIAEAAVSETTPYWQLTKKI